MTSTEPRPAATLPPVVLTPDEAAAIAVALAARPDGLAAAPRAALEKVLGALESDPVARARLLSTTAGVSAEAGRAESLRSVLEQAVTAGRVLALGYRDGRGRVSRREVEPQLLVRGRAHWFLVAWCRERQALRWFRTDRIDSADLTRQTAPRRDLTGLGAPPASRHPAGRARRLPASDRETPEPASAPPRLVLLPGGRVGS